MSWSVVVVENGVETVGVPMSYADAVAEYEKKARKINAVDREGNYLHPDDRVMVRKVQNEEE